MEQLHMLEHIEILRKHLYVLADRYDGNLLHPQVIQASEALDVAICRWSASDKRGSAAG